MHSAIRVTIQNKRGLHARAAAKFVKTVECFEASIRVCRADSLEGEGGEHDGPVDGTSLLGLMMLAADPGTVLEIRGEGTEATAALENLRVLIEGKFGEE